MEFEHPVYFNKEAAKVWGQYYVRQAQTGSGIPGYNADLFQRGEGFLSALSTLWRFARPVVRYLGPRLGKTLIKAGSTALENNENFGQTLLKEGKLETKNIVNDLADKFTSKLSGKGYRKRRRIKRKKKGRKNLKKSKKRKSDLFF